MATHIGFSLMRMGMSEGAQWEWGERHSMHLLGVTGHRHVDSFPGRVFGKGLPWVIHGDREGSRIFSLGSSLDSPVPVDELLAM